MQKQELQALFARMAAGDREAFEQIYHELKRPVFTIAARIVGSVETAEDITQELFLKLFLSPPDSSVKNPRAWIFRIARNLSIDALRKKQNMPSDMDDLLSAAENEAECIAIRLDVEAAIRRLPQAEREILSLHLNGDLTFGEIALIVGLSVPATYRRYCRALKTMRELLKGGFS